MIWHGPILFAIVRRAKLIPFEQRLVAAHGPPLSRNREPNMRKVFWCCLAAGAAVCCAFWAAAYISQNPDSSLGRVALVASQATCAPLPQAAHSGSVNAVETDELIPADPVPVDDVPPAPEPGSRLPPEIAGLLTPPPIVIHDEEAFNIFTGPSTINETKPAPSTVDVAGAPVNTADISESLKPHGPSMMPYCKENVVSAPIMPYCADDDAVPNMPPAPVEDMEKVSAVCPQFNALAFWMGFFSGPGQMTCDPTYTVRKPMLPGADESSEPPASHGHKQVDPIDLFSHPRHLQMPRPAETESDTMEMRPSDWKPYSLDPGPF